MPVVYRVIDSREPSGSGELVGVAGAVVTDAGRGGGRIMPGEYWALSVDDDLVPLPHPVEESTIRRHGETFFSASWKGRLVRVQNRICMRCGHVFDSPRLSFVPGAGCLPGCLLAVAVMAYLMLVADQSFVRAAVAGYLVFFCVFVLTSWAGGMLVRWRFADRDRSLSQASCPSCQSTDSRSLARTAGRRVTIGEEWVEVSSAGRS